MKLRRSKYQVSRINSAKKSFRELRHFSWTGANHFFVNAAKDALVIGSGTGDNGLWLDGES